MLAASVATATLLQGCASTPQVARDEGGQSSKPATPEIRFDLDVRGRAMPQEFRVSENLINAKVDPVSVDVSDHVAQGLETGAGGGARVGLELGLRLGVAYPPLVVLTPVLVAGGVVVGGVGGTIVGAGVGGTKQVINISAAHRSEHESVYQSLTASMVFGAQEEIESQKLLSLSQENAAGVESTQMEFIQCMLWIEPLRIRAKEKRANASDDGPGLVNEVEVVTAVEVHRKTDQLIMWRTQYRATFRYAGDPQMAADESMNQAGKEIAGLALKGLKVAKLQDSSSSGIGIRDSSGKVVRGTGRPPPHSGGGPN
jgi:hypothetical protein